MKLPVRMGWIGYHVEGVMALERLLLQGYSMECVITLHRDLLEQRSGCADYEDICKRWKIPLYRIANINDEESIALLKHLALDVAFVIGWSQIVRKEALESVAWRMIGAHASLLPRNRGSAPINWALIRGECETGNSLIWLADEVDAGEIIDQTTIPITPYDDCSTLYEKVAQSNYSMIAKVIPQLMEGKRPGVEQPYSDDPLLPRRRPEDGQIDWTWDSAAIYNFVRALTRPYPGALSWLDGEKWYIWRCSSLPGYLSAGHKPGAIVGPFYGTKEETCGIVVACGEGAVVVWEMERSDGEVYKGHRLSDQLWEGSVLGE